MKNELCNIKTMQSSTTSILLLLCSSTLVFSYQVPVEYGTNQNPTAKSPSDTAVRLDIHRTELLSSKIIEGRNFDGLQSDEEQNVPKTQSSYVQLPEDQIRCDDDSDCADIEPELVCGPRGLCECSNGTCWTYYVDASSWPAMNVFSCGICGSLGSACNHTNVCDDPGICMRDNYCHCRHNGEHDKDGICWIYDTTWELEIALGAMALILFFAVIVMAYNVYVTRPWQNGCRRRRPARDVTTRHRTDRKTPAFTVRDFYGDSQLQDHSLPVQADVQTADTSSTAVAASTDEIRENIYSEIETAVQQESSSAMEPPESLQQRRRFRNNESSSTESVSTVSSVISSVSSNSSSVNSERPLISTSDDNSIQTGYSSGFSIGRVFNRDQRRDDYTESTRF